MEFIDQFFIFPVYVFHISADIPCFLSRPSDFARVAFGEENESIVSSKSHDIWNFPHFPFDHDNSSYGAPLVNSWFHNCVLCGRPSTRYYYRIPATSRCVLQSKTYSFEAISPFGIINPINITIIGDLGNDEKMRHNSTTLAIKVSAEDTDFFLHLEDISYVDNLMWYLFNYGSVHVVTVDIETNLSDASQPAPLLFSMELNRIRHNVPWIIVVDHRPFLGNAPYHNLIMNHRDNCDSCQKAFAEVFYNFNVDFYFCVHVYWSERRHLFNGDSLGRAAEGANTLNATRNGTTSANIIPDTYDYTR
ncbi:unnamed protein product [Adineta ricciae]|uniref:Uncharacterized protein n=1 Tax=Adineta ricciae TaxID=249248 RepID=A0A816ERJ5_ADIRI|nr:unnamed protein product [Adineta ricciae]CAF1652909.1 unnamed protein product [Adineta ricciae]